MPEAQHSTSSQEFSIAFGGPALAGHTMDVQALGPALIAIGHLCQEANRVINGPDSADINVRVKATGEGSFEVVLELVHSLYRDTADLVRQDQVATAKEILEWLGLGASPVLGLLAYRKWRRRRKLVGQEQKIGKDGKAVVSVTVEGEGRTVTTIAPAVQKLSADPRVCAAQRRMLAPLGESGIDELRIQHGGITTATVSKDELDRGYFDLDPDEFGGEEPVNDPQSFDAVLVLRAPIFVQASKWQFFYGDQRLSATLRDREFVRSVFEGGARFGVGDRFRVRLCLTQVLLATGHIRNDYEILKVIEIIPGSRQLDLSLDGNHPAEGEDADSA